MQTIIGIAITLINALIKLIGAVLSVVLALLPTSPFKDIDNSPIIDFLGYLNYLIPVTEIVSILTVWCSAIALYYFVQIVLRWLKVID